MRYGFLNRRLHAFLARFIRFETGAIAIEWVVITAGVIGLSIAAFKLLETKSTELSNTTGKTIASGAIK